MALLHTIKVLSGLLVIGLLLSAEAHALEIIELNDVKLGPSIVEATVRPGESLEQVFTIRNQTGGAIRPEPYVQDFYIENGRWHAVEDPDARWSPMAWVTIVSSPEKLGHTKQDEVVVRFDVPPNAETGEHVTYFTVRFMQAATGPERPEATGITAVSEIRVPVFLKVTDFLGNFAVIRSWLPGGIGTKFWNFSQPVFTVSAVNTGNVHLQVRGKIVINDLLRNQKTELNLPRFVILPGAEREMVFQWSEAPFIGYFRGKMQITYDDINFEEREFSFIIIPLLTMAGTLSIMAGVILAVVLYIRKLQKRLAAAEKRFLNTPGE